MFIRNRKNLNIYLCIVLVIIGIAIDYVTLSTTLNPNDFANVYLVASYSGIDLNGSTVTQTGAKFIINYDQS